MVTKKIRSKADSARKKLSNKDYALLSLSYVLFGLSIFVLLLLSFADVLGYGFGTRLLFSLAALLLIAVAYAIFRTIRAIDIFEFIALMLVPSKKREETFVFDVNANILLFGLILIALTPISYTITEATSFSAILLTIGGLFIALAAVGYVLALKT